MDISIRKATIADLPNLLAINYSSFEANATYDSYIDMNWIHTEDASEQFQNALTKDGYYAILAEAEGKPIGFLFLTPKKYTYRTVKMIELDIVAVLPEYRSKGIGKMLIDDARKWAKAMGYQTIYVLSYSKNEQAVAFYQREGFKPIDTGLELTL